MSKSGTMWIADIPNRKPVEVWAPSEIDALERVHARYKVIPRSIVKKPFKTKPELTQKPFKNIKHLLNQKG